MKPPHHRVAKPLVLHTRVVSGTGGGPEKTILNSPRHLEKLGYRGACAYFHPPHDPGFESIRARAAQQDAPLHTIPDRGITDWRVAVRALNLCRRLKVAIWHGHDYKSNLLGLLLRRFWRMRLVTTVHGWVKHTERTPLYYAIDRFCLPRYESVIAVSEDLYQESLRCRVPPQNCHLIENAIDTEVFSRAQGRADAKRVLGLDPSRFVVGAVGRLSSEKGFDALIRACDQLVKEGLDPGLIIVGEGDQEAELRGLIRQLGREDRFHLLGFRADIKPIYEAMDLYVLSSLREGLPNVLLEAQALGVPVVSTRVAGAPRLIADGESGLLIEPGSVEALVAGIGTMIRDGAKRERFARAGRAVIEDRYDFSKRMEKVAALYDALLR